MELQQFPSWWEKLLYCQRYEIKGHQTVRRRQRSRTRETRLFVRRSKFNSATANKLERFTKFLVPLTATLFFWSKFTCDNMSYWQDPRFAVNLHPPYWEGVAVDWPATMCHGSAFGGFRHGDKTPLRDSTTATLRSAFGGKIVLDMGISFLYTWDINRFPLIRHQ